MLLLKIAIKGPRYIANRLYRKLVRPIRHIGSKVIGEYINWAQSAMNDGEYKEAIRRWKKVIKRQNNATTAGSYLKLARCYEEIGLLNKSENILKEAIARFPKDLRTYKKLFSLSVLQQDYQTSLDVWSTISTNFNPKVKLDLWVDFSKVYRQNNKFKYAENIVKNGLSDFPGCEAFKAEFAEISMQQCDYRESLNRWSQLLSKFKDNPNTESSTKVIMSRLYSSILSRLINIKETIKQIEDYNLSKYSIKGKKIAVYTAISGNYDNLKLPEILEPSFDYIVFTDQKIPNTGIWITRPLPFIHSDSTRSARYVKTHPHTLLNGYDLAIWIDANIMITGDISKYVNNFLESKKPIGAIPHPRRQTVYQEAAACIEAKKDDSDTIKEQINYYRSLNFFGDNLIESNFMIFDLRKKEINRFFDFWWGEIDKHSRRDQLSFNYALELSSLDYYPLMPKTICTRNNKDFVVLPHANKDDLTNTLIELLSNSHIIQTQPKVKKKLNKNNPTIDIVVCVHNALNDVKECLKSIEINRSSNKVNLIIIDDGSESDTAKYLDSFVNRKEWVTLFRNREAGGYTKAANKGLRLSTADLVILLNSDTIVTKNWTKKMSDAIYSMPGLGLVGPMSSAASHQSIPEHHSKNNQTAINKLPDGLTEEMVNKKCEEWTKGIEYPLVPLVHGFCFGVTRDVINKIGYLDEENFPRGYGEENDYCFRAVNAGFGLVLAIDTYIFHEKSKSYSDPAKRIELMKNGAERLAILHGKDRIMRSIQTMQQHPVLVELREKAKQLYDKYEQK